MSNLSPRSACFAQLCRTRTCFADRLIERVFIPPLFILLKITSLPIPPFFRISSKPYRFLPSHPFLGSTPEKKTSIFAFRQGFRWPDGLNYRAKITSILWALAAIRRGAFLPYFGKQAAIMPPFPHEQKRTVLRDFPVLAPLSGAENGAQFGVICLPLGVRGERTRIPPSLPKGFLPTGGDSGSPSR